MHSTTTCSGCMFCGLYFPPPVWCTNGGAYKIAIYWPHTSALVAYNGGTSVGHGSIVFLEPDFVPSPGTLDVGHGHVKTLFLGLILCLVTMTPCKTMPYWPHTSALVANNGGSSVGHQHVKLCYIGRVTTSWWPHRVLCALWTGRPIVKVTMGVLYGTGNCTYYACIAKVASLSIFYFFYDLHNLLQKKDYTPLLKKRFNFFYNSHDLPQKKLHAFTAKKLHD